VQDFVGSDAGGRGSSPYDHGHEQANVMPRLRAFANVLPGLFHMHNSE